MTWKMSPLLTTLPITKNMNPGEFLSFSQLSPIKRKRENLPGSRWSLRIRYVQKNDTILLNSYDDFYERIGKGTFFHTFVKQKLVPFSFEKVRNSVDEKLKKLLMKFQTVWTCTCQIVIKVSFFPNQKNDQVLPS